MKFIKLFMLGLLLMTAAQTFAQTESYDLATFTPPKDWKRQEGDLALSFSKYDKATGKFCIIAIYPSLKSSGDIETDLQNEWREHITKPLATKAKPEIEKVAAQSGWEAVLGAAKVESDGGEMVTLLTVHRGYGRVISILITINDLAYQKDFENFLSSLKLNKTPLAKLNRNANGQDSVASSNNLVGNWGDVSSGGFGVIGSGGGVSTGRGGNSRSFVFKADGTYTNVTYADVVFNGSRIQTHETGTYKINGNTLTLNPAKMIYRRNGVDEAPNSDWRNSRSYSWRIERDGAATNLVLITGTFEDRLMFNR